MIPAMEYIPQPAPPLADRVPSLEKEVQRLEARGREHEKVKARIAELTIRLDKLFRADRISRGRPRGLQLLQLALEGAPESLSFRRAQVIENRFTVLMHDEERAARKVKNEREVLGLAAKSADGLAPVEEAPPRASSLFGLALQRAYGLDAPVEPLPYSEEEHSIIESFSAGTRGERWVAYGYLHPLTVTRDLQETGGPAFPALPSLLTMAPPSAAVDLADMGPLRFELPDQPGSAAELEPPPASPTAQPSAPEPPPVPVPAAAVPIVIPGSVYIRGVPGATVPPNAEVPATPSPTDSTKPRRKKTGTEEDIEAKIGALDSKVDERSHERDIALLGQLERDLSAVNRLRLSRDAEQMLRLPTDDIPRIFEDAGVVVSKVVDRSAVRYASQVARAVVVNGQGSLAAVVGALRQVDASGALLGDIRIDSGEVGTAGEKCIIDIHIYLLSR